MAVQTVIKTRRDTAANWTSTNPVLAAGEAGLETDTGLVKYGNATDAWVDLDYAASAVIKDKVKNSTGSAIAKGAVVYISGANGDNALVSLADADTELTSSKTLGLASAAIADGEIGTITTNGFIEGLDTSAATAGDSVWLSGTAGGFVFGGPPAKPAHGVYLGVVTRAHATQGAILVKVQNGYELNELHDLNIVDPVDGQALVYDEASGLWVNGEGAGGGGLTVSETAPTDPAEGDMWMNSATAKTYVYYDSFWVEKSPGIVGPAGAAGASGATGAGYDYVLPVDGYADDFYDQPFIGGLYFVQSVTGAYRVGNSVRFYINPDDYPDAWVEGKITSLNSGTANIEYYAWSDSAIGAPGGLGTAITPPYMTLVGGPQGAGYDYELPLSDYSSDFPLNWSIPPFVGDTYPIPSVGGAYKVGNSVRFYINPDEKPDGWVEGTIVSFDGTTANIEYYAWSDSAPYTPGAVGSIATILPYMTLVGKPGASGASGVPTAVEVSSDISLESRNRYFVDTTAARFLTLSATPVLGDEVQIFDATGTAETNNITVSGNGNNINGLAEDALLDANGVAAVFIYTGSTYGWRLG